MNTKTKPEQQRAVELLCIDGVMAKGYGCVAKYAMHDQELSLTAKGLYAYLCSLTGGGTTAWPRRDNILKALQLSKTTYYKALNTLTDAGYITISTKRISGQWDRNVYTIVSNPKRFTDSLPEGSESKLRFKGMLAAGYGMIPRLAMQDQRMNIREKALYAYMICYANTGTSAFPQVSTIRKHLQISADSFQKYMRTLETLGYIIKKQRRVGGRFSVFDYYICEQPVVRSPNHEKWDTVKWDMAAAPEPPEPEKWDTAKQDMAAVPEPPELEKWDTAKQDMATAPEPPEPEKWDTAKQDMATAPEPPEPEKWDTVKQDMAIAPEVPELEKWDTVKWDTIFQDTEIKPNPNNSQEEIIPTEEDDLHPHGSKRRATAFDLEQVRLSMLEARGIPRNFLGDKRKITAALRIACDFHENCPWSDDPAQQERYETVFEALCLMCCRQRTKVRNRFLFAFEVIDALNSQCVDMLPYRPDLTTAFEYLVEAYETALQERASNHEAPLKHPVAYAKYVIWDALQIYQRPEEYAY